MRRSCFVAVRGKTDEGRVVLTFYGRSQNRFYRLGSGIRNGQLSGGGGGGTGDFQGHKEGVYCKGQFSDESM